MYQLKQKTQLNMDNKYKNLILKRHDFKHILEFGFNFKYPFFYWNNYLVRVFPDGFNGDCTVKVNLKDYSVSFYNFSPSLTEELISTYQLQKHSLDYFHRDYVNIHVNPRLEKVYKPIAGEVCADGWYGLFINKQWFDNILREVSCCL